MGEHVAGEKVRFRLLPESFISHVKILFSKQAGDVHPMLGQRRRLWSNINTTLNQCLVFCWFGIWSTFTVCMFLQDIHDVQE